jgi:hypothetical protein
MHARTHTQDTPRDAYQSHIMATATLLVGVALLRTPRRCPARHHQTPPAWLRVQPGARWASLPELPLGL